jgi:uncharacterized protein YecA (UPF0149 family)
VAAEWHRQNLRKQFTPKAGAAIRSGPEPGPNDPCPCGSGKKYKECCLINGATQ